MTFLLANLEGRTIRKQWQTSWMAPYIVIADAWVILRAAAFADLVKYRSFHGNHTVVMRTDFTDLKPWIWWSLITYEDALITTVVNFLCRSLVNVTLQCHYRQAQSRSNMVIYRNLSWIWHTESEIWLLVDSWHSLARVLFQLMYTVDNPLLRRHRRPFLISIAQNWGRAPNRWGSSSASTFPCNVIHRLRSWLTMSSLLTLEP